MHKIAIKLPQRVRNEDKPTYKTLKVREILDRLNAKYDEINIRIRPDVDEITMGLLMLTGFNKFPNVYFGNEHIGGLEDLLCHEST